jgi:hypothetical protein
MSDILVSDTEADDRAGLKVVARRKYYYLHTNLR